MKKKAIALLAVFCILILAAVGVVALSGGRNTKNNGYNVVTSFYPVYIMAENLCEGIEGVHVSNLTPNQTGCLHDYQMTTEDMKKLDGADALLLNGGGMETFVEKVAGSMPELKLIYSDAGVDMLTDEEEGTNAHAWLDPERYRKQVSNLADGLSELDPEHKAQYEANRDAYLAKIDEVMEAYRNAFSDQSAHRNTIIFHDAFAYLEELAPVTVLAEVEVEGDNSALSAAELADVVDTIRSEDIDFIIVEEQYKLQIADRISEETGAEVLVLDSLVTGDGDKDAWIRGMKDNLEKLREYL